jgi:hypothetical protein
MLPKGKAPRARDGEALAAGQGLSSRATTDKYPGRLLNSPLWVETVSLGNRRDCAYCPSGPALMTPRQNPQYGEID